MQLAITLAIVSAAAVYTAYSLYRSFPGNKSSGSCGSGCGNCPAGNKKGEPVELVPLRGFKDI